MTTPPLVVRVRAVPPASGSAVRDGREEALDEADRRGALEAVDGFPDEVGRLPDDALPLPGCRVLVAEGLGVVVATEPLVAVVPC